jgi:hypothetical protein
MSWELARGESCLVSSIQSGPDGGRSAGIGGTGQRNRRDVYAATVKKVSPCGVLR